MKSQREFQTLAEFEQSIQNKRESILTKGWWSLIYICREIVNWIRSTIAFIFIRLGFFVHRQYAWNTVVRTIYPEQVWNLDSHVIQFFLPRLKKYVNTYPGKYVLKPASYGTTEEWVQDIEDVIYFLEILLDDNDEYPSHTFNKEKYYRGERVLGKVLPTIWY